jgi:rod shape-determining protein MreC
MDADFELVPYEAIIDEGDIILTTSLGDVFPNGLLVGTVEEVEKKDTGSFQTAKIKPAFNLNGLKNVFVITDF